MAFLNSGASPIVQECLGFGNSFAMLIDWVQSMSSVASAPDTIIPSHTYARIVELSGARRGGAGPWYTPKSGIIAAGTNMTA